MGMAEVFVLLLSLLHDQHNTKSLVNCFDLGNAFNFSIHQISSNLEQVVFPPRRLWPLFENCRPSPRTFRASRRRFQGAAMLLFSDKKWKSIAIL